LNLVDDDKRIGHRAKVELGIAQLGQIGRPFQVEIDCLVLAALRDHQG
jgi:hypothetical protein